MPLFVLDGSTIVVKRHGGGSAIVVMRHDGDMGLIWWALWVRFGGSWW